MKLLLILYLSFFDSINTDFVLMNETEGMRDTVYCVCMNESGLDTTNHFVNKTRNLARISTYAKYDQSLGSVPMYGMRFHIFSSYYESIMLCAELLHTISIHHYWGCKDCSYFVRKLNRCLYERNNVKDRIYTIIKAAGNYRLFS